MRRAWMSAALILCCSLAGCVGRGHELAPLYQEGDVGCSASHGEVVFRFEPALYDSVTTDDDGEWLSLESVSIQRVSVAGDFNEWSKQDWKLSQADGGAYELRTSLQDFQELGARPFWAFKFVVNGLYWVEPPPNAPNRVPSNRWQANRSHNLVLRLP